MPEIRIHSPYELDPRYSPMGHLDKLSKRLDAAFSSRQKEAVAEEVVHFATRGNNSWLVLLDAVDIGLRSVLKGGWDKRAGLRIIQGIDQYLSEEGLVTRQLIYTSLDKNQEIAVLKISHARTAAVASRVFHDNPPSLERGGPVNFYKAVIDLNQAIIDVQLKPVHDEFTFTSAQLSREMSTNPKTTSFQKLYSQILNEAAMARQKSIGMEKSFQTPAVILTCLEGLAEINMSGFPNPLDRQFYGASVRSLLASKTTDEFGEQALKLIQAAADQDVFWETATLGLLMGGIIVSPNLDQSKLGAAYEASAKPDLIKRIVNFHGWIGENFFAPVFDPTRLNRNFDAAFSNLISSVSYAEQAVFSYLIFSGLTYNWFFQSVFDTDSELADYIHASFPLNLSMDLYLKQFGRTPDSLDQAVVYFLKQNWSKIYTNISTRLSGTDRSDFFLLDLAKLVERVPEPTAQAEARLIDYLTGKIAASGIRAVEALYRPEDIIGSIGPKILRAFISQPDSLKWEYPDSSRLFGISNKGRLGIADLGKIRLDFGTAAADPISFSIQGQSGEILVTGQITGAGSKINFDMDFSNYPGLREYFTTVVLEPVIYSFQEAKFMKDESFTKLDVLTEKTLSLLAAVKEDIHVLGGPESAQTERKPGRKKRLPTPEEAEQVFAELFSRRRA